MMAQNMMMNNPMMNQNMMYQNMMNNPMMMMNNPMMNQNMMSMMMAQMIANNTNNSQNNDSQSQPSNNNSNMNSNGGFTVMFRTRDTDNNNDPISVQCMPNDKLSEVIEKYRSKANDHDETKKFIFNATELNLNLTVAAAGIQNQSTIFVVNTRGVKGA